MKYLFALMSVVLFYSCASDDDIQQTFNLWEGPMITFEKEVGADPNDSLNQDRITDAVWITRGNSGGQIYNIVTETAASNSISPEGTRWAEGTLSEVETLTFTSFRSAVGMPKNVVGKQLVMHLEEADVYLGVEFISWSSGQSGGFSYMRTTEN